MTPREHAQRTARLAAYGSADKRTPADYSWLEAVEANEREMSKATKDAGKRGKKLVAVEDEDE